MTENAKKSRELLDTKYGVIDASSVTEKTDKNGKAYAVATMHTAAGKDIDVYAHGEKSVETLKEKAASGASTFVMGELLAGGKGISANKFEAVTYTGKVVEIAKEGENEFGPWARVKMQVEGKEKPIAILATDDDVARLKAAGDSEVSIDVAWRAGRREDNSWFSSAISAQNLMRSPAAPKAEEPEAEAPGL